MSIDLDYLHDVETRTTDPSTGGQKGVKLTQIGALDPVALIELGRVAGMGADKYAAFNYLKGFEWSKAYNAMQRHAALWWAGEDRDLESGQLHIAHAAWMAMALISFALRGLGTDDRPPRLKTALDFPDHADMSCDEAGSSGFLEDAEERIDPRPEYGMEFSSICTSGCFDCWRAGCVHHKAGRRE